MPDVDGNMSNSINETYNPILWTSTTMLSMTWYMASTTLTAMGPIWLTLSLIFICSAVIFFKDLVFQKQKGTSSLENILPELEAMRGDHETADLLQHLVEFDGAGSWPPQASHGKAWPAALRPYHDVYLKLAKLLPTANVSLDTEIHSSRRFEYRTQMRDLLHEKIDMSAVKDILLATEAGNHSVFSTKAYNGFYACIAVSRHAFRWGTIPVVKVAQEEKLIDFPPELDLPWNFIRRRYNIKSQGGNVTSNYLCNFGKEGQLVYEINSGMAENIRSAEYNFAHIFVAMEQMALPIYHNLVKSIVCYEQGQREACVACLEVIRTHLPHALDTYRSALVNSKIPHSLWMPYVQGFQAWGAGEIIDGTYVEYDGLSGNQQPLFHFIDAFLGIDPYLTEESLERYIHSSQRKLSIALRKHSFRQRAILAGHKEIEAEMEKIKNHIRVGSLQHF
ncbi:hypothetical protein N7504_005699 [Penicillium tannophilum]|nr:hypothetical protein N7504_005699 [Penicillium tannophilum]